MGAPEVEAFLTMLATEGRVSASTHNQALSALLFLYREVLAIDLPWLDGVNRPTQKRRIPSVLTKEEVAALFQFLDSDMRLLAQLLYGTGMRLMEGPLADRMRRTAVGRLCESAGPSFKLVSAARQPFSPFRADPSDRGSQPSAVPSS